jgi:hypothetical protein
VLPHEGTTKKRKVLDRSETLPTVRWGTSARPPPLLFPDAFELLIVLLGHEFARRLVAFCEMLFAVDLDFRLGTLSDGPIAVSAGQPAPSGIFTRAEVTFAWPRPDGTVGSDREPVALFTGEAVHAYLGHLSDETIEAILNELSIEFGAALGQHRIYGAFADWTWILDAGERFKSSPDSAI